MIAARNLAAPPWAHLAMGALQLGKDAPCIELAAVVAAVRRSKWEVCHVADTLQDSKGNPLKSPTGRQLFSRTSWRFSWFGLQVRRREGGTGDRDEAERQKQRGRESATVGGSGKTVTKTGTECVRERQRQNQRGRVGAEGA